LNEISTTKVFKHLRDSNKRYVVEQGGTRSSKTYNILIWLIYQAATRDGIIISIVRKTFPSLRSTSMRDTIEILETMGLYSESNHNKSESTYQIGKSMIEFVSVDSPQKIRGRKRHICFINEGNELTKEEFFQLNIRTTERMIIDFNPSEHFWVFDDVIPREDCDTFITTYKDNPFLSESLVAEIERLKQVDEYYWKVYGLGELAAIRGVVFSNYEMKSFVPDDYELKGYGMDFGFTNDPTTLIEIRMGDGELWVRELIWRTGMTNQDIAERIRELGIENEIVADSSEPKSIEELRREGVNIRGATKGQDSIRAGIDLLRRYKINVHPDSMNLNKEFKSYKYKQDKDGNFSNQPIDRFNHGVDALRYYIFTNLNGSGYGEYEFL